MVLLVLGVQDFVGEGEVRGKQGLENLGGL